MTAVYEHSGVHFLYPENWTVTDEETTAWPRSVSLQSPGGGFWSLMVYGDEAAPDELTRQVVAAMREEYDELEAVACHESFQEVEATGFDMMFYCLDLVVASRTLSLRTDSTTLLLVWQAEGREFERLEPVFRAITTSLLQSQLEAPESEV